ncbi:hypothetical protein IAT38_004739 [Cryptococcus sp. DSM 104549]
MLLFTVVGPVKGQRHFTFALQPGRKYTVGSSPKCDIVIEHRNIENKEGEIIVGEWNMMETPFDPPTVRWNKEKQKNGTYRKMVPLMLEDPDNEGSTDLDDYKQENETTSAIQASPMGIALMGGTEGIAFADQTDVWFACRWEDVHVHYDKIDTLAEDPRPMFKQYGILYTESFQWDLIPTHTITEIYKVCPATSIAVCMNRPILKPEWVSALLRRLRACWKLVCDSQDSFSLPDVTNVAYLPTEFAGSVPSMRRSITGWRQEDARTTLFEGWSVICMKSNGAVFEGNYLRAMGAEYEDMDLSKTPIQSLEDLDKALKGWLAKIDGEGGVGRSKALVMFTNQAKARVTKQMLDDWGYKRGIGAVTGNFVWMAINLGDTAAALEHVRQAYLKSKEQDGVPPPPAQPAPAPVAPAPAPAAQPPAPVVSDSTQDHHADAVPSTFPDESAGTNVPLPAARPAPRRPLEEPQQETVPETHVPPAREKLVRRKGRPRADPFAMFKNIEPSSGDSTPEPGSQPQATQASFVPESVAPTQRGGPSSSQAEALIPATQQTARTTARARRAAHPQRSFFPGFDAADTSAYIREAQAEQDAIKARELYEETAPGGAGASLGGFGEGSRGVKRARGQRDEETQVGTQASLAPRRAVVESSRSREGSTMVIDVDGEDEEEDLYALTLKRQRRRIVSGGASAADKEPASEGESNLALGGCLAQSRSASRIRSPTRSPSPEIIPIEVPALSKAKALAQKRARAAEAAAEAQSEVLKPKAVDTAFLAAIEESRKKRAAAEKLEKGFGQLAIYDPKGQGGNEREVDYGILDLDDFKEEMRGNFIEVVKMPLFRKDLGEKKEREVVDSGKPNFKKFKKKNVVKREPLQMVLSAPAVQDVEMAEPYWPTQAARNPKTQSTQSNARSFDPDDDDLPLLPAAKSQKRRLADNPASDDDDEAYYGGSTGRTATQRGRTGRSRVPDTAEPDSQDEMPPPSTARTVGRDRRTRGDSVVSEVSVSSVGSTSTRATTRTARGATTAKGKGKGRGAAKEPVLVEDSDEDAEADGVDWGIGAGQSSSRRSAATATATGKGRGTRGTRGASGTATLDDDEPSGTATVKGRGSATQSVSSTAVGKRKNLLRADDDDGMGFGNFGKKRRVK